MTFNPAPKPSRREKNGRRCSVTNCTKTATTAHGKIPVCQKHRDALSKKPKPKKGIRKKSKTKFATALRKARDSFQLYVRLRDSDENGVCTCICCGFQMFYRDKKGRMQGGHYHKAELYRNVLFDERNVNAQCWRCNKNMGTAEILDAYTRNLKKKIGAKAFNYLDAIKSIQVKLDTFYMIAIKEDYEKKYKELYDQKFVS